MVGDPERRALLDKLHHRHSQRRFVTGSCVASSANSNFHPHSNSNANDDPHANHANFRTNFHYPHHHHSAYGKQCQRYRRRPLRFMPLLDILAWDDHHHRRADRTIYMGKKILRWSLGCTYDRRLSLQRSRNPKHTRLGRRGACRDGHHRPPACHLSQ